MKTFVQLFTVFLWCNALLLHAQQDGRLDPSFGNNGRVITRFGEADALIYAMQTQPNGKIVVGGDYYDNDVDAFIVARYNENGTLDSSFGTNGYTLTSFLEVAECFSIALQPDGKIVAAGLAYSNFEEGIAVARYHENGSLDMNFGLNGTAIIDIGKSIDIRQCVIQPEDGKIVIAGSFTDNDEKRGILLIRLLADGALDESFGTEGIVEYYNAEGFDMFSNSLLLQPDGKIVVGGVITDNLSFFNLAMVRLLPNGARDNSFGNFGVVNTLLPSIFIGLIRRIALQPDGKIVAVGEGISLEGLCFLAARFSAAGVLDDTFGDDGEALVFVPFESSCSDVTLQADGKIIVTGFYSEDLDNVSFMLVRLTADGLIDDSFGEEGIVITPFEEPAGAFASAIQPDGKILAGGALVEDDFYLRFAMARYLSELNVGVINFKALATQLLVYPNPLRGTAVLEYELPQEENLRIDLYDMQGRRVQTIMPPQLKPAGKHVATLPIDERLPAGMYLLRLEAPQGQVTIKVMK
ncbi:MAG TPA: T9SS type A sorting domain-containing protein [Saprospiraceae bacterium]|nr:T9SS type A sorting domain-containing protein [Saprospiraceae bacterium]HMP15349.1 T9SS type A sorting domain-containing protein [Saprospiraceae bacterium]